MNQEKQKGDDKKQWEKPMVSNLSVLDTRTGNSGTLNDLTNPTLSTAITPTS